MLMTTDEIMVHMALIHNIYFFLKGIIFCCTRYILFACPCLMFSCKNNLNSQTLVLIQLCCIKYPDFSGYKEVQVSSLPTFRQKKNSPKTFT